MKDPLIRFAAWIEEHGVADRNELNALREKIAIEVDEASEYAENAPMAEPESVFRHVYVEEGGA